ncbi:MAG: FG-GAP repeat domain-containing protein [Phycisphaerales bacterium JB040]
MISDPVRLGEVSFTILTIELEGTALAIADINADGAPDVLSAGTRLAVLLGDGEGGLRRAHVAPAGDNPVELAISDLNADGHADLVVANHEAHYVTLLLGDGTGRFTPADGSPHPIDVDPHPHAAAAADLDGDGRPDLLVDHSPRGARDPGLRNDPGGVLVQRGLADTRFDQPGLVIETGGVPYRGFTLADINNDGRPDLIAPLDRSVAVLLNSSAQGHVSFEPVPTVRAEAPFTVAVGDLNADDHPDLIVGAGEESASVEVHLGDGQGQFEPAPGSPFRHTRGGKNARVGDFNADGFDDVAIAAYSSDSVLILLGGRDAIRTATLPAGHEHPWGLATGDLNADGADDLIVIGDGDRHARLFLSDRR